MRSSLFPFSITALHLSLALISFPFGSHTDCMTLRPVTSRLLWYYCGIQNATKTRSQARISPIRSRSGCPNAQGKQPDY